MKICPNCGKEFESRTTEQNGDYIESCEECTFAAFDRFFGASFGHKPTREDFLKAITDK